jgi:hypothetical protein
MKPPLPSSTIKNLLISLCDRLMNVFNQRSAAPAAAAKA